MYVATDPVASRGFGGNGDDWLLYRVTLPQHHVVFDLRHFEKGWEDNAEYRFPDEIVDKLKKAGCELTKKRVQALFRKNMSHRCRELGFAVLKALGVESILYNWTASQFDRFGPREEGALMILKTDKIPEENIKLFTKDDNLKDQFQEERRQISKMFTIAKDVPPEGDYPAAVIARNVAHPLWPQVKEEPKDLYGWMESSLFDIGESPWEKK